MDFKDLFKIRRPGHGQAVQDSFASASKRSKSVKFPVKDNSRNSGGKKSVSK